MTTNIGSETADRLILEAFENIRKRVEADKAPLSSEDTFRFLFAWELGRLMEFPSDYRFDFECNAYSELDSEDTFLDLLVYTDPNFKIALEFKLPKSSKEHKSAQTQLRARIIRDVCRLSHLVRKGINSIHLGYFLCATNEGPYIAEGRKTVNPQYKTYHGTVYRPSTIIPKGEGSNGIHRELLMPNHEVRFEWEGINQVGFLTDRVTPTGRFAWLKPIKVWA